MSKSQNMPHSMHWSARSSVLSEALDNLELIMQEEGIWPDAKPTRQVLDSALQSTVPFAVDSLPFESWLAFIFIPKMRIIIAQKQTLPAMQITPAAQVYLNANGYRTIAQLQTIDDIASEKGV
ncbi:YqcC family protein [Alteromonas mediterranea]|uniref:YqcC family protein n=1 Tax=Alteromonas mediterranea TaxID=314275 RepID=UPI001E3CDF31|nr:YqcC family protein [Alteromonas mediterranea]